MLHVVCIRLGTGEYLLVPLLIAPICFYAIHAFLWVSCRFQGAANERIVEALAAKLSTPGEAPPEFVGDEISFANQVQAFNRLQQVRLEPQWGYPGVMERH